MRTNLILLILLFPMIAFSQSVQENVTFDNPSDLSDHFYGMQSLVQIPSNGITGGCLQVPDSNNWGNDNSRYCSKYLGMDGVSYTTSVMFYYSDTVADPNSFDRPVSMWMSPHSDPNHYIITSLAHNKKIELLTYFSANSSIALSLNNSSWFQLSISVMLHNDSLIMNALLTDLGHDGLQPPTPVGNIADIISDSTFARDNAIEVSISGSKKGGAIFIDNFSYDGVKSADSCLNTKVAEPESAETLTLSQDGNYVHVKGNDHLSGYEIYDVTGKKVLSGKVTPENTINISRLFNGVYFFRFEGIRKSISIRII